MIDQSRAYQYAKWCTQRGNRKVGKYVKLQARKWLRIADGRHKNAYVSEKAYRKICKLLKLMIHPDLHCSMYDGLEDYAWFLIAAVFCTRRREDDRRFYQTAILEIARKNFKTFNSAVIFILGMLTEPRFSRFFSVAPDFKLSSELRLAVRKIIKVSPALTKYFKINRDMITCLINEIEYTPLAYSNDGMDGRLANIFLADEAGALDSYPVEAMRSSQITLVNKLGIIISTQYPNDNNVMIDEVDIAKKVLDGVLEKENVFALLYEPDDALRKRWETDDLVIYQANPVAVNNKEVFDSIKDLRTMAILYPWMEAGSHAEPQYYLDYLNAWAADGKVIRMVITGTEINTLIYIEDVTQSEKDGTGDRYVTVAIREYCDLEAKEVAAAGGTQNNGRANDASSSRKTQSYTIVSGDTLSVICRRYYGKSSAKYYNALAKYNGIKNPHLIYPGVTIQVPSETVLLGGSA